jgi:hypothetical protein
MPDDPGAYHLIIEYAAAVRSVESDDLPSNNNNNNNNNNNMVVMPLITEAFKVISKRKLKRNANIVF